MSEENDIRKVTNDPRTMLCRQAWCLESAVEWMRCYVGPNVLPTEEEVLANLLDEAYLRGRREERELLYKQIEELEEKLRKAQYPLKKRSSHE